MLSITIRIHVFGKCKIHNCCVSGFKKKVLVVPGEFINDADHPPVPVEQLAKHVNKLHKSDDRGYMIEYNVMPLLFLSFPLLSLHFQLEERWL